MNGHAGTILPMPSRVVQPAGLCVIDGCGQPRTDGCYCRDCFDYMTFLEDEWGREQAEAEVARRGAIHRDYIDRLQRTGKRLVWMAELTFVACGLAVILLEARGWLWACVCGVRDALLGGR